MTTLRGHSLRTKWHPLPEIAEWPMDHTFVSTGDGRSWSCFGRGLEDEPDAPVISQGEGDRLWAAAIAGADQSAGIDFGFNGICHHCANRILIPAAVDVAAAPGNELATPIFGKYGLGANELALRLKEAAFDANREAPGSVSESQVVDAVARVTRGKDSDLEIIASDIETFLDIRISAIAPPTRHTLIAIYTNLYERREFDYHRFVDGRLTREGYLERMHSSVTGALTEVQDLIGEERFRSIFPYPIRLAAQYLFYNPPAQSLDRLG